MPTRDSAWPNGTPCWIDYGAPDIDAAKDFYTAVLGWSYTGGDPEYGGYFTCVTNGLEAAGLAPQQDASTPPRWTTYFATDDIGTTANRITGAGGAVVFGPMEVGPMGQMAIATDPEGHPFGLWQAGQHIGVRIFNEPGSLVWNEASVDDLEPERAFYGAVFGFHFDEVPEAGGYATFATGDRPLGGLGPRQPGTAPGWTACFSVTATDEAVAAVQGGGGKITVPAQDTPYGRFAVVEDPWGAAFSVMQDISG